MHLDNDYSNLLFQTKISFWLRALFSVSGFAILMIGILFLFEGKIIEGSISLVGEVLIYFIQKVFKVREDDFRNKATKKSKYLEIGNMWNLAVQGIDGMVGAVDKKEKLSQLIDVLINQVESESENLTKCSSAKKRVFSWWWGFVNVDFIVRGGARKEI